MFQELEASRNQPLSFRKFDEIVAKTGDQIGAPFCADCAQRIGAYELYQQTNQSVEALMTVLGNGHPLPRHHRYRRCKP